MPSSPATSSDPAAPNRLRRWIYRLILTIAVPVALLGGLEGALRLGGYGYSTAFLIRTDDAYQSNTRFGWRFFPKSISREATAIHLPVQKPAETYRIIILGGSAAQGVPDGAYAFGRFLEVMLAQRFPSVRFEVINAAMTAVNSHVMLPVARDCRVADPDMFIVYMGNNEVTGPFGPGTAFLSFQPNLRLIRMSLWVKGTRLGQLMDNTMRSLAGARGPVRWEGMDMMAEQRIALDDPRLPATWEHFRRNLTDICQVAHQAGAQVILCTVPVNLRHCAPFASVHRADLSADDAAAFDRTYAAGILAEEADDYEAAIDAYLAAAALDNGFADVHFRLGRCALALGRPEEAGDHFNLAREHDALRFRADNALNDRIRQTASAWAGRGVTLVDAEKAFAESTSTVARAPGEDLFYEHVHLTPQGNYELARAVFDGLLAALPATVRAQAEEDLPVASFEHCAERLALTGPDRQALAASMWRMAQVPPFTGQLDHAQMRGRLLARRERLWQDPWPTERTLASYDQAVQAAPNDPWLRYKAAQAYLVTGEMTAAETHLKQLLAITPNDPRAHLGLGVLYLQRYQTGRAEADLARAAQHTRRYMDLLERRFVAIKNVVDGYSRVGLLGQAEIVCRQALTERPNDTSLLNLLANTLLSRRQARRARHVAEHALRIDDRYAVGWNTLGMIALTLGRPAEAVEHLVKAVELDPYLPEAYANLGFAHLRTGDPNAALASLARAVDLAPDDIETLSRYGQLLQKQNRLTEAVDAYRRALLVQPAFVPAAAPLVWLLATSDDSDVRDPAAALELARQTARLTPNQPTLLVGLAAAYAENGQFDQAIQAATQALTLAQENGNDSLARTIEDHRSYYQRSEPLPGQAIPSTNR